MNFEDVGRVWREQGTGEFQRRKIENLSDTRMRAERLLGRIVTQGTWIGLLALALCVPLFSWGIAHSPKPWMAGVGSTIIWTWCVVFLMRVRSLARPRDRGPLPVRHAVESEVARLRLLERIQAKQTSWRFLLAFVVGEVMAFEGFRPEGAPRTWVSGVFYTLLVGLAVPLGLMGHRRRARPTVRTLREDLESWLSGLDAADYGSVSESDLQGGTY